MGTDGRHCRPGSGVPTPVENSGSMEVHWPPPAPEPLSCGLGTPLSSAPETENQPPSSLLLAPNSTFLPRVDCKYFISCLVDMYSHTESYAWFCSPWWVSCQSLNERPLPVDASAATTLYSPVGNACHRLHSALAVGIQA